jgi:hypothetical protein
LWLESFLQTWQGSFVLVSHDNTLLDSSSSSRSGWRISARASSRRVCCPPLRVLVCCAITLDLPTLLWLESFLQTWQGSFVLVSHDNTLLDAVSISYSIQ